MKKTILFTIGILSIFVLTGCSSNNANMKVDTSQPLTKIGQYHEADSNDPKATLIAIKNINSTKKVKQVTFKFNKAKLLKMEAKSNSQLSSDEENLGIKLPKAYYEYQLDYSLKNNSDSSIYDNGAEIILPNSKQLSTNEGAIDSLVGEKIQSHASKDGFIQAKVSKEDKNKLNKFKFVTPELINKNNESLTDQQQTLKLN